MIAFCSLESFLGARHQDAHSHSIRQIIAGAGAGCVGNWHLPDNIALYGTNLLIGICITKTHRLTSTHAQKVYGQSFLVGWRSVLIFPCASQKMH
jgi:hypothetical protein